MKQPGFIRLATLALLSTLSFFSHGETILRLAYAENSQPVKDALHFLGQQVEEKTGGDIKVQYFPDGQLGGERELVELTQVGVVDITKVSSGLMESFSPEYGVFSLPYLFATVEEYYRVMDNPQVMEPVYQSTAAQGFILYALASGGTSIAALFAGGLVAGVLWGVGCMLVTLVVAKRRNYRVFFTVQKGMALKVAVEAIPSLLLIVIIVGGIVQGIFTAIEASAIAVVYTLLLTMVFYRTLKIKDLPSILLQTVVMTGVIMFLLATSSAMSFSMSITNIPAALSDMILGISANKLVILLVITVFLLIIGAFMDIGPAILIFTPILLPIMAKLGVDPVHFGIIMIYNLAIGTITPPVGSGLYVGASVGKVKVEEVIKPLLPFYGAIIGVLLLITYIPEITLFLPRLLGIM